MFTGSQPTLVFSCIFKAMWTNVTKPVHLRPCYISPMPCHLRQKPSVRNVPSSIFCRLDYPIGLINSTVNMFIHSITTKPEKKTDDGNTIRIVLPFKDQIASNTVRTQLRDLSNKIAVTLQPIFVRKKLEQDHKPKESKSAMRCLWICLWSVWCRLYGLHSPTSSTKHCWTQVFSYR